MNPVSFELCAYIPSNHGWPELRRQIVEAESFDRGINQKPGMMCGDDLSTLCDR